MALQFAMLLAIEFPDAAGDAAAGKRTIVVRVGGRAGARLYAAVTHRRVRRAAAVAVRGAAGARRRRAAGAGADRDLAVARVVRGGYADSARFEGIAFWSVALLTSAGAIQLAATILGG